MTKVKYLTRFVCRLSEGQSISISYSSLRLRRRRRRVTTVSGVLPRKVRPRNPNSGGGKVWGGSPGDPTFPLTRLPGFLYPLGRFVLLDCLDDPHPFLFRVGNGSFVGSVGLTSCRRSVRVTGGWGVHVGDGEYTSTLCVYRYRFFYSEGREYGLCFKLSSLNN